MQPYYLFKILSGCMRYTPTKFDTFQATCSVQAQIMVHPLIPSILVQIQIMVHPLILKILVQIIFLIFVL